MTMMRESTTRGGAKAKTPAAAAKPSRTAVKTVANQSVPRQRAARPLIATRYVT